MSFHPFLSSLILDLSWWSLGVLPFSCLVFPYIACLVLSSCSVCTTICVTSCLVVSSCLVCFFLVLLPCLALPCLVLPCLFFRLCQLSLSRLPRRRFFSWEIGERIRRDWPRVGDPLQEGRKRKQALKGVCVCAVLRDRPAQEASLVLVLVALPGSL